MARRLALVVIVAFALGGLAACGDDGASASPTITATEYKFGGPSEFRAGVVNMTFRNNGQLVHEGVLLGIGDTSESKALEDLGGVIEGGPIPDYVTLNGGVNRIEPGQTGRSRFEIKPGRYLLVCTLTDADSQEDEDEGPDIELPPHYESGMKRLITVTGEATAQLEDTGTTVTARDYSFDTTGLKPGENNIVFRNTGPAQIHNVSFSEFPAGVDESGALRAFQALIMAEEGQPPPPGTVEPEDAGDSPIFSPGLAGTFTVTLQAGRTYLLACFVTDKAGGQPHAIGRQMVRAITIR